MAYDEGLAQIFEEDLADHTSITTKKMFGGLCFMRAGHMLCGVHKAKDKTKDMAMFRVGPDHYEAALEHDHVMELGFTGRPMKGLVETDASIFEDDDLRARLLAMALDFTGSLKPK